MMEREEVLRIAHLAYLELSEEEIVRAQEQIPAFLEMVAKIGECDIEGVEPTSHPLALVNVWRADEPRPSLTPDEALANAPDRQGNFFRVPPNRDE